MKNEPLKDGDVLFEPKDGEECALCGLASFAHIHRVGTKPKDYERVEYKDSHVRQFDTGANRDADHYKIDYEGHLNPLVLERFGEYMHGKRFLADGTFRDSDNWQKGFPMAVIAKSLVRHGIEFWKAHRGHQVLDRKTGEPVSIEDILCAIMFNSMAYLLELLKRQNK